MVKVTTGMERYDPWGLVTKYIFVLPATHPWPWSMATVWLPGATAATRPKLMRPSTEALLASMRKRYAAESLFGLAASVIALSHHVIGISSSWPWCPELLDIRLVTS